MRLNGLAPFPVNYCAKVDSPQVGSTTITAQSWATKDGVQLQTPGRQPAVFLDRDGVVNYFGKFHKESITSCLIPGSVEALVRLMKSTKLPVFLVSNQGNVCHGNPEKALRPMTELIDLLAGQGVKFEAVYYSPVRAGAPSMEGQVSTTKPEPGMFYLAAQRVGSRIDLADSYMVGDSDSDCQAAKRAHPELQTIRVKTGNGKYSSEDQSPPDRWADNLAAAIDWIIAREEALTRAQGC